MIPFSTGANGLFWTRRRARSRRLLLGLVVALAAYGQAKSGQRLAFEVASVKPSPPAPRGLEGVYDRISDQMYEAMPFGGVPTDESRMRVILKRRPITSLIAMAYGLRQADLSGPGWISDQRFEIVATIPKDFTAESANEMMKSLLEDRFGLRCHWGKKQETVYTLLIAKSGPKLQRYYPSDGSGGDSAEAGAAPSATSALHQAPSPGSTAPGTVPWNHKKAATMADVARILSSRLGERVIDKTGIEGRYDVTISGFPPGSRQVEDGTGPSILDAVKQLGLRLERSKESVDILVIDNVRMPTEN